MKFFLQLLSFGLLATSVSAVPTVEERQSTRYSLTVSTKGNAVLNGQTLEVVNSVLGVYPGKQTAAQVYPVANPTKPGLFSLHTLPIGIVDHVLALQGSNGFFTLVDTVNPAGNTAVSNIDTFILKNGKVTQNIPGGWFAFPSSTGWSVNYYDGTSIVTQDYVAVDILYKKLSTY
ncbi:hypothetical protein BKA67DRAFT_665047 [Truncatella angustata]|uniref:Uncharacterized protein n=1 Tax=Truncatella angustata TaxID=152316 RepID=A0A9P8UAU8_9PEZI|nr:uncharacterized protein BKA67DRAFT_665047 [Truncatella angustata]KAH6645212.1 hypothetical protein BKA67DRAFT_665047 [Truncatella angustata]KAH8200210.1 hypothetical protein TruAng_005602 [Truncatella angustata]